MKRGLSDRLKDFTPSVTLEISALANELKAKGNTVYSFGIGEPDFNINDEIKNAAIEAINDNFSHYTPVNGLPKLKEAVCTRLKRENNLDYTPDEIICSNGAKHSLFTALTALLSLGDEVIIPSPYWVSYAEMVKVAGGVPVIAETKFEDSFLLQPDCLREKINDKTKALIINNPSNPTGTIYDLPLLKELAEICVEYGIYIISDEIYDKFLYDNNTHYSTAAISDEVKDITITINGMSKTYAMPGWRLGYTAANKEIIKAMGSIQGQCVSHPCAITQVASIKALDMDQSFVGEMVKEYDRRRKYMLSVFDEIKGLRYVEPKGAFYVFVDINQFLNKEYNKTFVTNSAEFAQCLLNQCNVVVIPGSAFGQEGFVRFSYACSYADIVKGLDIFKEFLTQVN